MDTNKLEILKDYIVGARKVTEYIDDDNISFSFEKSPLIFDWKSEGFGIEYLLINDIFSWLCYLGLGDGNIADEEVKFINNCLDLDYTKDEIRKFAIFKLNKDFKNHIPISFMFFCEAEIVNKDLMISHAAPIYSENLFALFARLGESFIGCDGEITSDEKTIYNEYLHLLWQNLNDFKKRRGIDDSYDNLVGEDVLEKDINIETQLDKRIADKMNLVLKLISQGYSLYDLNNVAFISTDVIAKWFYKGRLVDEKFEEFHLKCMKINPDFESDVDEVIEHIDIFSIDDEINSNQKAENSKPKRTSKQKKQDYKLHINGLQSQFLLKEKNTHELIEKCFPAPQMTNSKFNNRVDDCSKIFYKKLDNTVLMIDSANVYSDELENEIKSNMDVLNEISSKLDSLHEELLITISKSGDEDVENILEEMARLIDSVKEY
ncbi:hypothetical protein [Methanobrevibacter sp.]|uniref:hypothetical protein n=1 Tax=Methanobrevibacter sp. TaxID=66852 RepID=UPI0038647E0B